MSIERLRMLTEKLSRTAKILVVEDDSTTRDILAEILREEGYDVLTAAHGKAALEMMALHSDLDMIILDLIMPIMGGIEFLDAVKSRSKQIPTILITGLGDDFYCRRTVDKYQLICYLGKPLDGFVVRAIVNLFNLPRRPSQGKDAPH